MANFITSLSIISSVASIISLIYIFIPEKDRKKIKLFKKIATVICCMTILLSTYLLFFPVNILLKNVESKITYYGGDTNQSKILIQEGEFIYTGIGEQSIQYYLPYKTTPNVEIINMNGYNGAPEIEKVTENQFILYRNHTSQNNEKYKWVAKGEPMDEIQKEH